jgi:hypothetical protein
VLLVQAEGLLALGLGLLEVARVVVADREAVVLFSLRGLLLFVEARLANELPVQGVPLLSLVGLARGRRAFLGGGVGGGRGVGASVLAGARTAGRRDEEEGAETDLRRLHRESLR